MSLCFSSSKNDDTREIFSAYPDLFIQNINCNITEDKFSENAQMIFRSCGVDVCGFDTFTSKYWGKKCNKCMCYFHFQLSIDELTDEKSLITITLVTGKTGELTKISKQLIEIIKIL
jgi:hypothetical protein